MNVKELIEILKKLDPETVIIPGERLPSGYLLKNTSPPILSNGRLYQKNVFVEDERDKLNLKIKAQRALCIIPN